MNLSNVFGKRLGGMSLGGWLRLFLVGVAASVILSYVSPGKTNRSYLKELIETGSVEKAAIAFVGAAKKVKMADNPNDAEWARIEKGLSECMVKEANSYLISGDPYLDVRGNKETPHLLAARFLKACGAME